MKNDNNMTTTTQFTYDEQIFSDLHKDTYGFRPSSEHEFWTATSERKQVIWDQTVDALKVELDEETARKEKAAADFEASIINLMTKGAANRAAAIRWILESEGVEIAAGGYMCYCLGLPYSYTAEIENAVAARRPV